jgi:CRISPR-associated protein Cas5t
MTPLRLLVDVPVCAFRPYASREYQDTYPVPPPSAVYGMLLSLVGVPRRDKDRHRGVAMALAVEAPPPRSRVFRKLRRGEDKATSAPKYRPDYQDVLTDLQLWVWLDPGQDQAVPDLPSCVTEALANPAEISRFGGLSLGESSYLIDTLSMNQTPPPELVFLRPDPRGFHHLTTWVDHRDQSKTRSQRFALDRIPIPSTFDPFWIKVGVP